MARTDEPRTLELRAVSAEGRVVRLAVELHAVEPSPDGARELVGTVRVLSPPVRPKQSLKLAGPTSLEGELRETLDGLPGPAWMVGGDLSITWCSPVQPANGAEAMLCAAARASDPQGWTSAHRRALTGETVGFGFATCGHAYRCQVGPVRDGEGAIVATLGVATDVSDLDEVARELTAPAATGTEATPRETVPHPR